MLDSDAGPTSSDRIRSVVAAFPFCISCKGLVPSASILCSSFAPWDLSNSHSYDISFYIDTMKKSLALSIVFAVNALALW